MPILLFSKVHFPSLKSKLMQKLSIDVCFKVNLKENWWKIRANITCDLLNREVDENGHWTPNNVVVDWKRKRLRQINLIRRFFWFYEKEKKRFSYTHTAISFLSFCLLLMLHGVICHYYPNSMNDEIVCWNISYCRSISTTQTLDSLKRTNAINWPFRMDRCSMEWKQIKNQ